MVGLGGEGLQKVLQVFEGPQGEPGRGLHEADEIPMETVRAAVFRSRSVFAGLSRRTEAILNKMLLAF